MAKRAPTEFALATCVADVRRNVAAGLISLPMGMENGGPMAAATMRRSISSSAASAM